MVLIHFATNLLLLIPLLVTSKINKTGFLIWDLNFAAVAYNVQARHEFLMAHIGVFKEEQNAFDLLSSLSWQLPLFMAVTALLDLLLVLVYMKWLHPWRDILQDVSRIVRS